MNIRNEITTDQEKDLAEAVARVFPEGQITVNGARLLLGLRPIEVLPRKET